MRFLKKKTLLHVALAILAMSGAALAIHPWLIAPLVPRLLASQGVEVSHCEIESYTRWALHAVSYEQDNLHFHAEEIRIRNPLFWLLDRKRESAGDSPFIAVSLWMLKLNEGTAAPSGDQESLLDLLESFPLTTGASQAFHYLDLAAEWVPSATMGPGSILVGGRELRFEETTWQSGTLVATGETRPDDHRFRLEVIRSENGVDTALQWGGKQFAMQTGVRMRSGGDGLYLESEGYLLSGPFSLEGTFLESGLWPEQLVFNWDQPDAEWIHEQFPGFHPKTNAFVVTMEGKNWDLSWLAGGTIRAPVEGRADEERLQPWSLTLRSTGNAESSTLNTVTFNLPFLDLNLSESVTMNHKLLTLNRPAKWKGNVDFGHPTLDRIPLDGVLDLAFEIDDDGSEREAIAARFSGSGKLTQPDGEALGRMTYSGIVDQKNLLLDEMAIVLERSSLSLTGAVDLTAGRELDVAVSGSLFPEDLPYDIPAFSEFSMAGRVTGSTRMPAFSGAIHVADFNLPGVGMVELDLSTAAFSLNGGDFRFGVEKAGNSADLEGELAIQSDTLQAWFTHGKMVTDEGRSLELQAPFGLNVARDGSVPGVGIQLIQPFMLVEPGAEKPGRIALSPGRYEIGRLPAGIEVELANLSSAWFQPWVDSKLPLLEIESLLLNTGENPTSHIAANAQAVYYSDSYGPIRIHLNSLYTEEGLEVQAFNLSGEQNMGIDTSGRLPLVLQQNPETGITAFLDSERAFQIEGSIRSGVPDFAYRNESLSLLLQDVSMTFDLGGTLADPRGRIRSSGTRMELELPAWEEPIVAGSWDVLSEVNAKSVQVSTESLSVMGNAIDARVALPVDLEKWITARGGSILELGKKATFTVSAPSLDMASLKAFLPSAILPRGNVALDLQYDYTSGFSGQILARDLSTRAAPNGYTLTDLNGGLIIEGYSGKLDKTRFNLNSRPAVMSGTMNWNFWEETEPLFNVEIAGEGIPLVRESDLLLRSDLNLKLARGSIANPVKLSGDVRLRDGLFLRNFFDFVRPGTATSQGQPPYFSVSQAPFSDWELDVDLHGDNFLKLNSPVARGTLSADLTLNGTLETPYLLGTVTAESGQLQLPFGRIRLESGAAEFTVNNPYDPSISARGSSNTLGYAIDLNVSGSLENPDIELESSPALSNDEIILLLTAGVVPDTRNDGSLSQSTSRMALYLSRGYLSDFFGSSSAENLRIRSGEAISEAGRETFQVEYDLRDDLSIIGEYDKYDDYNLDLRWKVRSSE